MSTYFVCWFSLLLGQVSKNYQKYGIILSETPVNYLLGYSWSTETNKGATTIRQLCVQWIHCLSFKVARKATLRTACPKRIQNMILTCWWVLSMQIALMQGTLLHLLSPSLLGAFLFQVVQKSCFWDKNVCCSTSFFQNEYLVGCSTICCTQWTKNMCIIFDLYRQ